MGRVDGHAVVAVSQIKGKHPVVALQQILQLRKRLVPTGVLDAEIVDVGQGDHEPQLGPLLDHETSCNVIETRGVLVSTKRSATIELSMYPITVFGANRNGARRKRTRGARKLKLHTIFDLGEDLAAGVLILPPMQPLRQPLAKEEDLRGRREGAARGAPPDRALRGGARRRVTVRLRPRARASQRRRGVRAQRPLVPQRPAPPGDHASASARRRRRRRLGPRRGSARGRRRRGARARVGGLRGARRGRRRGGRARRS